MGLLDTDPDDLPPRPRPPRPLSAVDKFILWFDEPIKEIPSAAFGLVRFVCWGTMLVSLVCLPFGCMGAIAEERADYLTVPFWIMVASAGYLTLDRICRRLEK